MGFWKKSGAFLIRFFSFSNRKVKDLEQRERVKESRERERERKCEPDTCLCFEFNHPFFLRGEKSSLHTHIYIYRQLPDNFKTTSKIYIFKKKTEMMASSSNLSFARAVAPSPRKLTRKSTLSSSNKRSSIKISASSIPIHIEYCEK